MSDAPGIDAPGGGEDDLEGHGKAPIGIPPVLLELLSARGPSGYEAAPAAVWREAASEFAEASIDVVGTPLALVAPKHGFESSPPRLMVMGHIDEIGLIVTHIDDDGFLWFRGVGGWDAQILVGQRLVIDTREGPVTGVVGKKPIHLLREEERKKVADIRDMHIDIGARDGKEARERVRIGDVAVIDAQPASLPNGRIVSRALDNRLGSYVALQAARLVAEAGGSEWEVAAVAAVQEEITFGGSRTSAFALAPDAAIVIDVTHATDAPGIDVKEAGKHELGSGPVLSRGATLNHELFELIFTRRPRPSASRSRSRRPRARPAPTPTPCTSRAAASRRRSISIPLRYMHSPVELVQLDDVEATARLIAAAALRLGAERSFSALSVRPLELGARDDLVRLARRAADRQQPQALRAGMTLRRAAGPTRTNVSPSSSTRSPSISIQPEPDSATKTSSCPLSA